MNPTCYEAATSQGFVYATSNLPKIDENVIVKSGSDSYLLTEKFSVFSTPLTML
jgi:hypothetical protein